MNKQPEDEPKNAAEANALRDVAQFARDHYADSEAPPDLKESIVHMLDEEDRSRGAAPAPAWSKLLFLRPALAYAAALLVLLSIGFFSFGRQSVVADLVEEYREIQGDRYVLLSEAATTADLEGLFAEWDLPFDAEVLDPNTGMLKFHGGNVHDFRKGKSGTIVYRCPENRNVMCEMYIGDIEDLPEGGETRTVGDKDFYILHEDDITFVFWEQGPMVCVMGAARNPEEVAQFAYAKAGVL